MEDGDDICLYLSVSLSTYHPNCWCVNINLCVCVSVLWCAVANSPGGHGPDSDTVAVTRLWPN